MLTVTCYQSSNCTVTCMFQRTRTSLHTVIQYAHYRPPPLYVSKPKDGSGRLMRLGSARTHDTCQWLRYTCLRGKNFAGSSHHSNATCPRQSAHHTRCCLDSPLLGWALDGALFAPFTAGSEQIRKQCWRIHHQRRTPLQLLNRLRIVLRSGVVAMAEMIV